MGDDPRRLVEGLIPGLRNIVNDENDVTARLISKVAQRDEAVWSEVVLGAHGGNESAMPSDQQLRKESVKFQEEIVRRAHTSARQG